MTLGVLYILHMNSNARPLLLHLVPEDPEPLREQIARQLRGRIARSELPAGELLPGHRHLARQHRVAPSSVKAGGPTGVRRWP